MFIRAEDLFKDLGIRYATEGKNIGVDWIGVDCPFCGDTRNHGGIAPDGTLFHCFVCGNKIGMILFLQKTLRISFSVAKDHVVTHSDKFFKDPGISYDRNKIVELPGSSELPKLHRDYLIGRNLDPDQIQSMFNVHAEYQTGDYKYRLIIPIYFNYDLVNFIARDVTDEQDLRYRNLPRSKVKIPIGELIYGWDLISKEAILVEGVFDVWNFGPGTVAPLGTSLSKIQIRMLSSLKRVWILFDNGYHAQKKAKKLESVLTFCGVNANILELPKDIDDPGELNKEQRSEIRKMIT